MATERPITLDDIQSSDEMKKERPDLKNLENLVTPNYAYCWKEIGIQLDIPTGILNSIEMGFPTNPFWCCNKMWMYWDEVDTKASWDRVLKAIASPAISAKVKSFTIPFTSHSMVDDSEMLKAVSELSCRSKIISINGRYKVEDDNWPLTSPKHFTSVALIHHKSRQTKREVLAVATLQKRGDFDLQKIYTDNATTHVQYLNQSKYTTTLSDIFTKVEGTNKYPDIILIEGVPGIGKTVLSKEIVFQWANGKLLPDITLLFLIYLRDTESHKITSLESFVNYVSYPQVANHIIKYFTDNKGKNIMVVFDGYDELSEKLRNNSFLYKMMTRNVKEIPFCNVVITSRPNVSAHLHDKVDLRVEILGFTNEDRKTYIVDALKHDDNKIEKVMKYLNNNPAINAYCYIPLNMTILLSFFQNDDDADLTELPDTQTGINEKFICTTISRYIRKLQGLDLNFSKFSEVQAPCDDHEIGTPCVGHDKGVPCGRILKEISKLAFKTLEKDKIVFTTAELQENCPCLESHTQSENWNGLGLLKAVKLFTVDNNLRNVSFNFLHFTVQEILAAYHITLMSEDNQLKCTRQTFWDNRYYNTWIMYVGLTKNQLPISFKHFLSGNWFLLHTRFLNWWNNGTYCRIKRPIINDKIKCLHLFQCFSEAENNELCQYVGQLLQENEIDLSGQTLSAVNILTISLFLTRSTTKHWKVLNLSECFIGDDGIKQLHNSFTSNNRSKVCIDTLNLSHNNLTQSSVESIAGLILEWDVRDIILNNVNQHNLFETIKYQVMHCPIKQNNKLYFYKFNENMTLFARFSESEYFILGFSSMSKELVDEIITNLTKLQASNDLKTIGIIHTLQDCTAIIYFNLGATVSKFEVADIAKVIENNYFIEYLCFTQMQYPILNENMELRLIFDALKSNKSLKYIDMNLITIDSHVVESVAAVMENNSNFKEMKISELLLRCDDFLLLKNHLVNITGLKVLSITGYFFIEDDIDVLVNATRNNYEIQQLTLSNCKVPIKDLLIILSSDNLNWVDLSSCQYNSNEVRQILCILNQKQYLKYVDLRENIMTSDAVNELVAMIKNNKQIQSLSLPNCFLHRTYLRITIQAMQTVSSLQYVDFSINEIDNELASDVATLFANNSELEQLNFGRLKLKQDSFHNLKTYLVKLKGIENLRITDCTFYNQDLAPLGACICNNCSIQELIISNCKIVDNIVTTIVRDYVAVFDQLVILDLSNSISINIFVFRLMDFLSCSYKLRQIILCNCKLQPNEIKQVLMIIKHMRHLETVDLSGNAMTDDSVKDLETMIGNNTQLQRFCLPHCFFLSQTSLTIILQAMNTIFCPEYLDFSTNEVNNVVANDITLLKLNKLKVSKLTLNSSGFQRIKKFLYKIEGLNIFSTTNCNFTRADADTLIVAISNNSEVQELNLPNCKMEIDQLLSILCYTMKLKCLDLSGCHFHAKETTQIFRVLKRMRYLECVNLKANEMTCHSSNEIAAMIVNNERLQKLHLPDCIHTQASLRVIAGAMQITLSLKHVDFGITKIYNEVASVVARLLANNNHLEQLNFSELFLKQSGFQHLKAHMVKLNGLKHLDIADCTFTNQDMAVLETFICNNHEIQKLIISNCKINDHKVIITGDVMDSTGIFDQLVYLKLHGFNYSVHKLSIFLSCNSKLKHITLSNCQLQSDNIKQILMILKHMRHLNCVDISGNDMTDDSVGDMEAMIVNNKQLQKLCLPNCVLDKTSLGAIIQAMQTVSSLQYVDFSAHKICDELTSDVAVLINNNNELKRLNFSQLIVNQNNFQYLKNYLDKIRGLKLLSITSCSFTREDAAKLVVAISNNSGIQEINLSNCIMDTDQLLSILFYSKKVKCLNLSDCHLHSKENKQILIVLKQMESLLCVDLSGNSMTDDVADEVADMIINNEDIQELYLPDCVLTQPSLRIIIQPMQTLSSLRYVDLSTNKIDNILANNVAVLCDNNPKLEQLKFTELELSQNGFNDLRTFLVRFYGIKYFSINDCSFTYQDVSNIAITINNNTKIQGLDLSNCKMHILNQLQVVSSLTCLKLNNISITDQLEAEVITIINRNNKLEHLEMAGCNMSRSLYVKLIDCAQFRHISKLNLSQNSIVGSEIKRLLTVLSLHTKLKSLDLSNCQLKSCEINQVFNILKKMRYLQCVNLGMNTMTADVNEEVTATITNNKDIQKLCLPDCILTQSNLKTIIQAMQTISSLQHVDFSTNKIDSELASDVALLVSNNTKLNELKFSKLALNQDGFQHLNNYLLKIKGLNFISITGCIITKLNVSNYKLNLHLLLSILSGNTELKWLNLSYCQLDSNEIGQIFHVLKQMKYLRHVDLHANVMACDAINDIVTMIKNNKHIHSLSLPDCVLNNDSLRIIFQAIHTSSLEYVDFSTNTLDNELASDTATLFANSNKLKQLRFAKLILEQSGFQNLKTHLVKIKGLKYLSITYCTFTDQDVVYLETVIGGNLKIQELIISNCNMIGHKIITVVDDNIAIHNQIEHLELSSNSAFHLFVDKLSVFLSSNSKLKQIFLCNCQLQSDEIKQILMILKYMRHLETVDLSGNYMTDDLVSDMEAMIVNNRQLQKLYLPNCDLNQASLRILIEGFYVDFSIEEIDELVSDILKKPMK